MGGSSRKLIGVWCKSVVLVQCIAQITAYQPPGTHFWPASPSPKFSCRRGASGLIATSLPGERRLKSKHLELDHNRPTAEGNFGRVFFGRLWNDAKPIVVKCPVSATRAGCLKACSR
jgi:hypothetical protein